MVNKTRDRYVVSCRIFDLQNEEFYINTFHLDIVRYLYRSKQEPRTVDTCGVHLRVNRRSETSPKGRKVSRFPFDSC